MGGILKLINSIKAAVFGYGKQSFIDGSCFSFLKSSLEKLCWQVAAEALACAPAFTQTLSRHTGTGCSFNSSRTGMWNWHTAALLFPSLPETKH